MKAGIPALKAKGSKVHLSYGILGLEPLDGSGNYGTEDMYHAEQLVNRIVNNVYDWDLDGVDIFTIGQWDWSFSKNGQNVGFHYYVFKNLRHALPAEKTISYTISRNSYNCPQYEGQNMNHYTQWHPMEEVISSAHRYIDYVNIEIKPECEEWTVDFMTNELGVPAYKIGWLLEFSSGMNLNEDIEERMVFLVNSIKQRGLKGLSLFTVNKEHNHYRGEFVKQIAQNL